jgi:succinate dehydrogenase/fumarate reductase flavoprotein subunit
MAADRDVDRDVDVVIVGSGAAGLAAALSARQRGAGSVLVAESEGVVGGSSVLSGGLIMGAGTRYQKALGIDDDADAMFHDYMQLNGWNVDAGVVRRFAELAGPTVEWLGDLGVEFYDTMVFGGEERVPRVHVPIGRGQAVVDILARHCREADVDVALGQRVDRLLTNGGTVTGVAVGQDAITAGAIVIATGGFGSSPEMLAEHFPSAARTGWAWYIGAEGSRGDAFDFGAQVGAQVVGHDHGLRLLHAGFDQIYEAYLPGWLVLVNSDGRRFVDETAPYGILDSMTREQGDRVYAVFDRAALEKATAAGVARYKHAIPGSSKRQSPHWNADIVEQMVANGKVTSRASVSELAGALGVPPANLEGMVARYNAGVAAGRDPEYLKDAAFLESIATPPFYGAELRPATVASTACGLRIDPDAGVRGGDGNPIGGLFAAGECTGGVVGAQYVGSGNNYANSVVFGRVAGASAATFASRPEQAPSSPRPTSA